MYGIRRSTYKHAYLLCFIKVVSGNGVLNSFDSRTAQSSPNRRSMHTHLILVLFSFFYFSLHSTPFLIFYLCVHVESTTRERRDFFLYFFFFLSVCYKNRSVRSVRRRTRYRIVSDNSANNHVYNRTSPTGDSGVSKIDFLNK